MLENMPTTITAPDGNIVSVDLCDSPPLEWMEVELTSQCNLRCIYCPKSDDAHEKLPGRNMDMSRASVSAAAALAARLTPKMIVLNGTGETTTLPDWIERCKSFKHGAKPSLAITTNFARSFSNEEISYLAELDIIHVSIDTADLTLLREMRRKVNLQTIIQNVVRLRAAVIAAGRLGPDLTINCVVTNKIVGKLRDLAALCVALGLPNLMLLDLGHPRPNYRKYKIKSILDTDLVTIDQFRKEIEAVKAFASANGLHMGMSPALEAMLEGRVKAMRAVPAGLTRKCLQPWQSVVVAADASIFPCCATTQKVGHINDFETFGEPEGIRKWRSGMLTGDLPSDCVECLHGEICETHELGAVVGQHLLEGRNALRQREEEIGLELVERRSLAERLGNTASEAEDLRHRVIAAESMLRERDGQIANLASSAADRDARAERRRVELERALATEAASRAAAEEHTKAIESATFWRVTYPLRRLTGSWPPRLRRLFRGGTKLVWWTITLRLPSKLRERQVLSYFC